MIVPIFAACLWSTEISSRNSATKAALSYWFLVIYYKYRPGQLFNRGGQNRLTIFITSDKTRWS